jgi:hypothetical protein
VPTKNQVAEQDRQSELRRTEACAKIIRHALVPVDGSDDDSPRGLSVGVLSALSEAIDDEVADIAALRRKGWQSTMKAHITAAEIVRTWRDLLVAYAPPAGPPRPPVEIAVDHRADTPAELDARLTEAFGPELAPVRHIRTALESDDPTGPLPVDGVQPRYGALCGEKTGSWTHRGGANCPTCIATYDDECGPYTGPTAFSGGPEGGEVLSPIDGSTIGHVTPSPVDRPWRDGPVTPEVARAMREAGPFTASEVVTSPGVPADEVLIVSPTESLLAPVVQPLAERNLIQEQADAVRQFDAALSNPQSEQQLQGLALNIVEPSGPQARPRMTPEQVRAHGLSRQRGAQHRSVSQVTGYADCGTRYALDDLEAPAWWNVGGKALHRCVETINRLAADDNTAAEVLGDTDNLWNRAFDAEIANENVERWPTDQWRVANRGKENFDWWRVEGPSMVGRYVHWLLGRLSDGWEFARVWQGNYGPGQPRQPAVPVIEFKCHLNVGASVPNLSIVDMALFHPMHHLLEVIDIKAGGSAPKDTFQLGVYGWALLAAGVAGFIPDPDYSNVRGRYWRARTGICVPEEERAGWPVLAMHPWPNVVDRYRTQDAMERQGFYQPNVSSLCGGCGVRDLCPAKA